MVDKEEHYSLPQLFRGVHGFADPSHLPKTFQGPIMMMPLPELATQVQYGPSPLFLSVGLYTDLYRLAYYPSWGVMH